jgi:hypothetical protein
MHEAQDEELRVMKRVLGTGGPAVSSIGLGAMGMSDLYGPTDRAESIATIHAARPSFAGRLYQPPQ